MTHGATEEGFRTGAVPFVPQQHINDLPMLGYSAIEVALLGAAKAEDLIPVPLSPLATPIGIERFGRLRSEGLDPVEYCPC